MKRHVSNLNDRKPSVSTTSPSTGKGSPCAQTKSTMGPLITIFALPKPFGGKTDLIQRNAINSWACLQPDVEVLLIGDENGIAETARELGVRHAGGIEFNQHGTPLVSSAFEIAQRESTSPYLAYCNSDVILLNDFVHAVRKLAADSTFAQFVAFGNRTDLELNRQIDFRDPAHVEQLMKECRQQGVRISNVCKEYFLFNRELYQEVPPFAVGRGNWDNWMIHWAKENQLPVVIVSELVTAIHQAHDYSHMAAGRFSCYVSGEEAQDNRRFAGGSHIVSGSTANWRLTSLGLRREKPLLVNAGFWADLPRFVRLILKLTVD